MKTVSVVGSTGSIGKTALGIVKRLGYKICALTANTNLRLLKQQADEFNPQFIGVVDLSLYAQAKELFGDKLVMGREALTLPCALPQADIVLVSVVGLNGIYSVLESIKHNKTIALANKESLVAGGEIVNKLLKKPVLNAMDILPDSNAKIAEIIPVDSEHSAIFQCLKSGKKEEVSKIILTASGGAFYNYDFERLKNITPKDIFHPNWSMGRKITLDSCSMMNKALEIIEAYWLFSSDKIDYVVHPQSIIHSMVEYKDGSTIAQLAMPDMSLPIQYAFCYPNKSDGIKPFAFDRPLTFLQKNPLFYAPQLAKEVIKMGNSAGAVFNAAGEAAAQLFEKGQILFTDIIKIVEKSLFMSDIVPINSVDDIQLTHNQTINKIENDYKTLLS